MLLLTNLEQDTNVEGDTNTSTADLNKSATSSPTLVLCSQIGLQLENTKVRSGDLPVSNVAKSPFQVARKVSEGNEELIGNSPLPSLMLQQAISVDEVLKQVVTPSKIAPASNVVVDTKKLNPPGSVVELGELAEAESISSYVPAHFLSESRTLSWTIWDLSASERVVGQSITERDAMITLRKLGTERMQ